MLLLINSEMAKLNRIEMKEWKAKRGRTIILFVFICFASGIEYTITNVTLLLYLKKLSKDSESNIILWTHLPCILGIFHCDVTIHW